MKCLPLQRFSCSSRWVSSLEIKAIHDLVQRYCWCCWPQGAPSFLRPLYNCILEYKWVYSPKKIFHLNSSQLNFFYKLHHPVFLQSLHKLNSALWLCRVAPVWDSVLSLVHSLLSVTMKDRWTQSQCDEHHSAVILKLQIQTPWLAQLWSNQNKIGNKL